MEKAPGAGGGPGHPATPLLGSYSAFRTVSVRAAREAPQCPVWCGQSHGQAPAGSSLPEGTGFWSSCNNVTGMRGTWHLWET